MSNQAPEPDEVSKEAAGRRSNLARLLGAVLALSLVAAACSSQASVDEAVDAGQDTDEDAMDDDAMDDDAMDDDAMMEDGGTVTVTIENIAEFAISDSGAFAVPASANDPAPALPGDAYEFSVNAGPGQRLSFATMFVQSNDWIFAPDPAGINLYDASGDPVSGDVTDQVLIIDAGTEIDQSIGEGPDQAPRQSGPDTGDDDEDGTVRLVDRDAADYVAVTLSPGADGQFDVRIENVSDMAVVPTPLAPGVYAVHHDDTVLFELGEVDAGDGLEALAEDGDPTGLTEHLADLTGTTTPLAPGAWVATTSEDVTLFELGEPDNGMGLEALAEDGDPSMLNDALTGADGVGHNGVFTTPDGGSEPGPVLPGSSYSFVVPVAEGERLSFATMFVQSNDWIFATPEAGLELSGLSGDITDELIVVDVGTEIDQEPGFGPDQAPRQAGPNSGADDPDSEVRIVEGRDAALHIRVTVEAS
ncbi:MAG: hypothetical protein GY939_28175 [Actinomycetia bacterium]|nr:hypothetical protein [Actinomycetes bacterium]